MAFVELMIIGFILCTPCENSRYDNGLQENKPRLIDKSPSLIPVRFFYDI